MDKKARFSSFRPKLPLHCCTGLFVVVRLWEGAYEYVSCETTKIAVNQSCAGQAKHGRYSILRSSSINAYISCVQIGNKLMLYHTKVQLTAVQQQQDTAAGNSSIAYILEITINSLVELVGVTCPVTT